MYCINACSTNHELSNTNGQLQKFIIIVSESGDIPNNHCHGRISANLYQNVKNQYQIYGKAPAIPHDPQYNQLLCAQLLGKNIYAWLASHAVGYGMYARFSHI